MWPRAGRSSSNTCKAAWPGKSSALPYAQIAARLKLTEPAVKMAVHRLRARYREILRAEIAHTVSSAEEVEEEIRQLFASFGP